jgi:hypothetical protein
VLPGPGPLGAAGGGALGRLLYVEVAAFGVVTLLPALLLSG